MKKTTYITMLRGINVGGKMLKMDALRKMCEKIGLEDVQTYIQSGNIIYRCKTSPVPALNAMIKKEVHKNFGFDIPVLTLTVPELEEIITLNPYQKKKDKDPAFLHITFLAEKADPEKLTAIAGADYKGDEFICIGKAIYLHCPGGYGNTKLNNNFFENKLKVSATTRNWKTSKELLNLATTAEPQTKK